MKGIRLAWAVAALACTLCSACGAAPENVPSVDRVESDTTQRPSDAPSTNARPPSLTSPIVDRAPSAEPSVMGGCPFITAADLHGVVARAVSGLDDTTAADGWSRACAWLSESGGSGEPNLLTIQIGWQGSLHEYSAIPGSNPIAGLADEAYALDDGDRIALRSGELVAVVGYSGVTALIDATARQVAEQLPE